MSFVARHLHDGPLGMPFGALLEAVRDRAHLLLQLLEPHLAQLLHQEVHGLGVPLAGGGGCHDCTDN